MGALLAATAAMISGCAGTVALDAAPDANDPLCAEAMVTLPRAIVDQERRWTDAQSTAAWGDPASVIFTCGVTPPGPTTLPCSELDGVDWIIDDAEAPRYRFTTYGRTPAVQVYLDYDVIGSADVLRALAPAARKLTQDGACTQLPGTGSTPGTGEDEG